jgi:hypothetical protein
MLKHTPEEMMLAGSYDPRLYSGLWGQGRYIMPQYIPQTQRFDLGVGTVLQAQDALDELANIAPFDVRKTDLGNLERLHTSAVLNQIIANPQLIAEVSPAVMKQFGGKLYQIAHHVKERKLRGIPTQPFYDAIGSYEFKQSLTPLEIKDVGSLRHITKAGTIDPKDIHSQAPGIYIDTQLPPAFRRIAAVMEKIRKRFAPHARIAVIRRPGADPGEGGLGHVGQDTYILAVGVGRLNAPQAGTRTNHDGDGSRDGAPCHF